MHWTVDMTFDKLEGQCEPMILFFSDKCARFH